MLLVDTVKGELIDDDELKEKYATKQPYGEWLDNNLVQLHDLKIPNQKVPMHTKEERARLQKAFGYTYEDLKTSILPMALNGSESIGAMGIDTPLAVLSNKHQPLFNYFKQLFAQVTNPPIDSIREKVVTSTTVYLGTDGNVLEEKAENCKQLKINDPILTNTDLLKIKNMKVDGFKVETIPIIYYKNTSLEKAIDHLFVEVDRAHREGANIIILSDRGVDENHVAIPSLLAVSALQQYLVQTKKRTAMAVILESGEPRDVHHFATLLGYGASAINPYLAQESIQELIDLNMLDKDYYAAVDDYNNAILGGIVKIAAKMGISTIQSYQGAKIFEAIGIDSDVINKYFKGTVSRIEGISLKDIHVYIYIVQIFIIFGTCIGTCTDKVTDIGQYESRHYRIQVDYTKYLVSIGIEHHVINLRVAMVGAFLQLAFTIQTFLNAHCFGTFFNFFDQIFHFFQTSGSVSLYCIVELFQTEFHIVEVRNCFSQ